MPNDGGQLTNEEIAEQFEGYGKDDFLTNEAPYSILVAVLNAVQDDFTKERITNYNFVPVVDDRNVLMGIVTRRKVLQELLEL